MGAQSLFKGEIKVINVGLEQFWTDLQSQGVPCVQLKWSAPTHLNSRVKAVIEYFEVKEAAENG